MNMLYKAVQILGLGMKSISYRYKTIKLLMISTFLWCCLQFIMLYNALSNFRICG